jgi:septal ring factor EnvC (AmiA/AmiB activator)
VVARNTEVANMSDRLATAIAAQKEAETHRDRITAELALERDRLYAEQKRADGLSAGLAALEAERISRLAELERTSADRQSLARELEVHRAGKGAASAAEVDGLRKALAAAERERSDLLARLSAENDLLRDRLGEVAASVARMGQPADTKPLPPSAETPLARGAATAPAAEETALADYPLAERATGTRH